MPVGLGVSANGVDGLVMFDELGNLLDRLLVFDGLSALEDDMLGMFVGEEVAGMIPSCA